MYAKLKALLKKNRITQKQVAYLLHITEQSVCKKLNGVYEWKVDEARKLQEFYFPEYTLDELLEKI